ncbi:MAG: hypothetical protein LBE32_00445 [Burkholderiales bacterium]|nr:hypothetical protein [Burkholderiales bacterium]
MKTLILLSLMILSACTTTPRPVCVETIPAAALYGCKLDRLPDPLPTGSRVSDVVAADVEIIEALAHCRADYQSLVNHIKIACPK